MEPISGVWKPLLFGAIDALGVFIFILISASFLKDLIDYTFEKLDERQKKSLE